MRVFGADPGIICHKVNACGSVLHSPGLIGLGPHLKQDYQNIRFSNVSYVAGF